jgi:hypothetical protein
MKTIETINGIYTGFEVGREKLPKSAILIGCSHPKLDGLYNFDPFTNIYWYTTKSKRYLIIKTTTL